MAIRLGSWKTPEFGLTERLSNFFNQGRTDQLGSNLFGNQAKTTFVPTGNGGYTQSGNPGAYGVQGNYTPGINYNQPQKQVLGTNNINSGGNGNMPSSSTSSNSNQSSYDALKAQEDAFNQQLESDYNTSMAMLGSQEQGIRGQADIATSQIDTGAQSAENELIYNQQTAEQAQNKNISTAETQAKSATQQARDLYRQQQQSNIAQLSALGLSSSSVSEALAEKLGIEIARRIGSITGSLDEIRQNATQEIGRIKTYYGNKLTDLNNQVRDQKAQIQNSLMVGINQINNARNQAASEKAARRAGLLSQVQTAIAELEKQKQQFEQQLKLWTQTKTSTLEKFITDPTSILNYQKGINTLNQTPGITQTFLGNYGVDANNNLGYYSGKLKSVNKAKKDDSLEPDDDL